VLAVCHECIIDKDNSTNDKLIYQGMSPDEIALVAAAQDMNV